MKRSIDIKLVTNCERKEETFFKVKENGMLELTKIAFLMNKIRVRRIRKGILREIEGILWTRIGVIYL